MKAIQIINPGEQSSLLIDEVPTPEPDAGEVLVKIKATAVNRADLYQRSGQYPPPEGASKILGLEMAGVIEQVGKNVDRREKGEAVHALLPGGGYAEYCVIPEKMGMPIPDNLSFEQAAAIPETFLTAYQALKWIGKLECGETVLIHAGGSGVGTAAIQLAEHLFNSRIITTASQKEKLATCKKLGADITINYKSENFTERVTDEIGESVVDLIIDFIGAPYWHKNIEILSMDGRLVYLSFLGGHKMEQMSLAPLLKKRLKIMASTLRNRSLAYKEDLTHEFSQNTRDLFASGIVAPVVDRTLDWADTEEAHRYMNQNKNTGKIVLTGM